jgi:hypothetical protein
MDQQNSGSNPAFSPAVAKEPTKLSEKVALAFLAFVALAMGGASIYSKFDDAARDNAFKVKAGECLHLDTMATSIEKCGSEPGLVKVLHVYKVGDTGTRAPCPGEVVTTSEMFTGGPGDSYCVREM